MMFGSKIGGYVRVVIGGGKSMEMLNHLAQEGVSLWDIDDDGGKVSFCVSADALSAVRRAAHHWGCSVSIRRRGGASFFRKYMKTHQLALFTAAFVLLLLWAVLSLVWKVDVVAEEGTSLSSAERAAILTAAEECGLHPPQLRSAVDLKATAEAILAQCPSLSWVGLSPHGVTMTIHVTERKENQQDDAVHGHIVAEKGGKIRRIFVLKGQKAVLPGDTVAAGDVLISGDIVYEEEGKEPIYEQKAAKGTVVASVWYEGTAYVPLEQEKPSLTGKTAGIVTLSGHGKEVILWGHDSDPFAHSVVKERSFSLFGWTVAAKTYNEATPHKVKISKTRAKAAAEKKAGALAKEQMTSHSVLLDRKVEVLHDISGALGVKVILECEEEIGKFQPLS